MAKEDEDALSQILEEIRSIKKNQKKMEERRQEDKFLSRLDMLFGVLVSITIFVTGLTINNSLTGERADFPLFVTGVSVLCVFVIALVGQYVAILRNNITLRFDFWAVFINGIGHVAFRLLFIFTLSYPGSFFLLRMIWYATALIPFVLIPFLVSKLFNPYIEKFPSRKNEIKKRKISDLVVNSALVGIAIRIPDYFLLPYLMDLQSS